MESVSTPNFKANLQKNFFLYFFIFLFLLKSLETLYPYEHGDALYYHLVGPRLWYQHSWDDMWKDLLLFIQAGVFDFFYIIPFFFFKSLLKVQLAGQFMHFLFSIGLASLLAFKKFSHRIWGPLAGICFLTLSRDSAFFLYAKNDGVLALVSLVAAILVLERDYSPKKLVLIGIFLGMVPNVKMNGLMSVLPLVVFFVLYNVRPVFRPKNILGVGILAFLVFLPTLIKNHYFVGNPFFPAFLKQIPGTISRPMYLHFTHFYGNSLSWDLLYGHLQDLFQGKFIFLTTPILFVWNFIKKRHSINTYFLAAISIFALYILFNGSLRHPRYFFSCYFLLSYFLFLSLQALTKWPSLSPRSRRAILFLVFALLCVDSKIDKSFSHVKDAIKLQMNHTEHEIVRQTIPLTALYDDIVYQGKTTYVISDYLSDSYYLPDGVRLHTSMMTPQAAFLVECSQDKDAIKLQNYSYAILYYERKENPCYQIIRGQGKFLKKVQDFEVYALPSILSHK